MQVKISSNPYLREIKFQKRVSENDEWKDITLQSDGNSELLKDSICTGFFPFIVKQIVDTITRDYYDHDSKVKIIFEGTDDEYKELEDVCQEEETVDIVDLEQSDKYLENARDILPEIRDIFKDIKPIIDDSVRDERSAVEREIQKFLDASSDQIPICIMGNYSTGKSTFINALIGCELLPSGEEPVTGKIYKIVNSKQGDRGYIKYIVDGDPAEIRLDGTRHRFIKGQIGNELNVKVDALLEDMESKGIHLRIGKVLEILEKYARHNAGKLDDLIELSVPFVRGLWGESQNNFVIFDTPGSNSASNIDHAKVLKKAMEDMSNGMPIFVSEYNSLDSTDNEKLYQDIKSMKELDCRFTMIIVNKADEADLEEEEGKIGLPEGRERRVMSLSIPKNMFGEGIFFVSSIIGLGAKTNGKFNSKHYLRVYSRSKNEYSDPSDELYQRLYRYNIMPEQLKTNAIAQAEASSDLIYANSGLLSIEKEIQTFGNKYSSYNKCHQSELFINKVIDIANNEIEKSKERRELIKQKRIVSLEKDKQELLNIIKEKNASLQKQFLEEYPKEMSSTVENLIQQTYEESLLDEKEEFTKYQEEQLNVEDYRDKSASAANVILPNLGARLAKAWEEKNLGKVFGATDSLLDDILKAQGKNEELENIEKEVREKAEDMIVDKMNRNYRENTITSLTALDDDSRAYWDKKVTEIKTALSDIIMGSSALTEERRDKLSKIIISYQSIDFDYRKSNMFSRKTFEKGIYLGRIAVWKFGELNLEKLRDSYNKKMKQGIIDTSNSVQESHGISFQKWLEDLEVLITENIVEFNPELHAQNEVIKDETRKILELEANQKTLSEYRREISEKMEWKDN